MPLSRKYCKSRKQKPFVHKNICKKYGLFPKRKSRRLKSHKYGLHRKSKSINRKNISKYKTKSRS